MSEKKSIYLHIPFCRKKCVYCDFYSETCMESIPEYIQCLVKEIEIRAEAFESKPAVDTIYFGGGTPSLLPIKDVEAVLETIDRLFSLESGAEVTFEINPGTVDDYYLKNLKQSGINRVSLGVQSFNNEKLAFLKRIHNTAQSCVVIDQAQKAGFKNIGLDLICGLPFENEAMWLRDLKSAIDIFPAHLSCYMLTIEPFTPLHDLVEKGSVSPVNNEFLTRLFVLTSQTLEQSGYEHYEISNFSRDFTLRSRHNSKYWQMKPYYGFGAAAHSYDGKTRSWNHGDLFAYMDSVRAGRVPVEESETLTQDQKILETIMLRLRTSDGLDLEKFYADFGLLFQKRFSSIIDPIIADSLGVIEENRFFLTLDGKIRLNAIVEAFSGNII